ncbi:hypothetical protein [Mycolicibacter arupensis]|jgi:hypothetical protein|uniref:hypothetical protein n=1 Tax=Mycolicibacter arupensis TaxID=342002 RepID=UPI00122CE888|nr:hypothetical protein [Mycolicibacter arupensis]KAA1430077.1 hypothetical protein F0402_15805 [Mycolicibacter arupensis]
MPSIIETPRADFRSALATLLGIDIPEQVAVSWVCKNFRISQRSVFHAIKSGKLPAETVKAANGYILAYIVRPEDALLLWGHRIVNPTNNP